MNMVTINEIFYSIQGEGKWMGHPNIFIRTTGCNLRCSYCDTTYAYDRGTEKTIDYIINEIKEFSCKKICITGGEPLIQKEIHSLLTTLIKNGYSLCVETNGSQSINPYIKMDNLFISLDIKCPSSGMHRSTDFSNLNILRPFDQVKFVIGDKNDYHYAKKILNQYNIECFIFFQPIWGFPVNKLASWILQDELPVCLGIQLHKYIWGNETGR